MTSSLTLPQLRRVVQNGWEEVVGWLISKPRITELPHPEQQILFEFASRLRTTLRSLANNLAWDRLIFDASSSTLGAHALADAVGRRAPIHIDTRQLFGIPQRRRRTAAEPDLAIAVHVLRSAPELVDLDDDATPRHQAYLPTNIHTQGWLLEEHVRQLDDITDEPCDGFLFVVYSNKAQRRTAVDRREVASWASWHQPSDALWWASRHFRAREPR
ncbi:MAG: hypothetical protein OZ921_12160 [Sorangiineae bacterium]|nr:hypothetical protein [Polyangiaceae bacterium]MEB2323259.1 hypothetical protein [Sorangiineae bacterium]